MSAWHERVDRDHDLQNPTSAQKIELAGAYLRLGDADRVLDVACGNAAPALVLARAFGCRIHGVEVSSVFAGAACRRIADAGLEDLIDVEVADASALAFEPGSYDVALCLGAAFVWGHAGDAAAALAPVVGSGGRIAIGEPFAREQGTEEEGCVDLPATIARLESAGVELTGLVAASEDDWDRYESRQWLAAFNECDAALLAESRSRRDRYLVRRRGALGWAIFTGIVS